MRYGTPTAALRLSPSIRGVRQHDGLTTYVQPVAAEHESAVHGSRSSQAATVPPTQAPDWQVSRPLQRSASSQKTPLPLAGQIMFTACVTLVSPVAPAVIESVLTTVSVR